MQFYNQMEIIMKKSTSTTMVQPATSKSKSNFVRPTVALNKV